MGPNRFGQVQIIKISPEKSDLNLNLTKIIWTRPKQSEPVQSHFGPIEDRAQPDWAFEFPDQTGPDNQICRTGPAGPD